MSQDTNETARLEYARAVHAEAHSFNRDLYSRAQIALTLNGLLIGAFSAIVSSSPAEIALTLGESTSLTRIAGALAIACIAGSVLSAGCALYSRHRSKPDEEIQCAIGNVDDNHLWFYARIAEVSPTDFIDTASLVDAHDEARIRLRQVVIMAPIMTRRARWVNRSYLCAVLGLLSFLVAGASLLTAID